MENLLEANDHPIAGLSSVAIADSVFSRSTGAVRHHRNAARAVLRWITDLSRAPDRQIVSTCSACATRSDQLR